LKQSIRSAYCHAFKIIKIYKLRQFGGDFNNNFNDKKSETSKTFHTFNLHLINNPAESTTRDDTTIDAVFLKYLEKITSQTYIS